jgi:hypothetical protein
MWDPFGEDAWLVSRPVRSGLNHSFVVVADNVNSPIRARFSYGPDRRLDGVLVSHSASENQTTGTNQGDILAWQAVMNGTAADNGIVLSEINATDPEVITAGNAIDAALGTLENPGNTDYDMLPHARNDGANSNSAAIAVAERASGAEQPLPRGTRNPGHAQSDRVPNAPRQGEMSINNIRGSGTCWGCGPMKPDIDMTL